MKHSIKSTAVTVKEQIKEIPEGTLFYTLSFVTAGKKCGYAVKITYFGNDGTRTSASSTSRIRDIGDGLVFLRFLYENDVTPIDLPYVEEDGAD